MAGVFLSYDREDGNVARIIATALENAGHSVWWDLHVRGGAQFSKVIEEALKAADAVVVLWSSKSVDSAWVRDEAAAGRDRGRLVPATIDGTLAPLGFRQFQTIDLTDWKRGAKSRRYKDLEQAITALGSNAHAESVVIEQRRVRARDSRGSRWWLVAAPLTAALAVGAYLFWPASSAAVPTVTVVPASSSAMSQALSRDLLAKLGILQASNSDALQLVEEGSGKAPDLIFKVDAAEDSRASKATLLLVSGKNRAVLWSGDFEQPLNKPSDLKQQLAYSAANVLECASDAYGPAARSLEEQTRRLYLNGCGTLTQVAGADLDSLMRTFREVIRSAPRFAPAWARLLTAEDEFLFSPPFDRMTPAALAQFAQDIAASRRVSPHLPEAYIGEADLISPSRSAGAMHQLDLAVEKNPDNASALTAHANGLMQVGRMIDAVSDARRAEQLQPFSPRAQEAYISALTYAGQIDVAEKELAKAEALFPGASNFNDARYRLNLRYGSAEDALKALQAGESLAFSGQDKFLEARIDPSAPNVAAAIEASRKRLDGSPVTSADFVQTLAAFGRTDELFNFLLTLPRTYPTGFSGVLFRPPFRAFWHDQRSMQIAARLGLIAYWRSSGHWPDLCGWPDLPYDCKKEAAKLST